MILVYTFNAFRTRQVITHARLQDQASKIPTILLAVLFKAQPLDLRRLMVSPVTCFWRLDPGKTVFIPVTAGVFIKFLA